MWIAKDGNGNGAQAAKQRKNKWIHHSRKIQFNIINDNNREPMTARKKRKMKQNDNNDFENNKRSSKNISPVHGSKCSCLLYSVWDVCVLVIASFAYEHHTRVNGRVRKRASNDCEMKRRKHTKIGNERRETKKKMVKKSKEAMRSHGDMAKLRIASNRIKWAKL